MIAAERPARLPRPLRPLLKRKNPSGNRIRIYAYCNARFLLALGRPWLGLDHSKRSKCLQVWLGGIFGTACLYFIQFGKSIGKTFLGNVPTFSLWILGNMHENLICFSSSDIFSSSLVSEHLQRVLDLITSLMSVLLYRKSAHQWLWHQLMMKCMKLSP